MKAVDGWIVAIGLVAVGLAALAIWRSREASAPASARGVPSAQAPRPPAADFPACQAQVEGLARWRCQVDQARRQHRLRCYGQRLFYVKPQADAAPRYYPWPAQLTCWNATSRGSH